jgi:HEAT repeat protein
MKKNIIIILCVVFVAFYAFNNSYARIIREGIHANSIDDFIKLSESGKIKYMQLIKQSNDEDSIKLLRDIIVNPNISDEFKVKAVVALENKKEDKEALDVIIEVFTLLRFSNYVLENQIMKSLQNIGIPAVKPLIEILTDENSNFSTIENVGIILCNIGLPAFNQLANKIKESGFDNKIIRPLEVIGKIGIKNPSQEIINILVEKLYSKNPNIVGVSAEYLKEMGIVVIDTLFDVFYDGNEESSEVAVKVLKSFGASIIDPLIKEIKDNSNFPLEKAKELLINIGNPSFIPVVEQFLKNKNSNLRSFALSVIKGLSSYKMEQETGIDPNIDILNFNSMNKDELKHIVSNSKYSITRAVALYYLGVKFKDKEFIKNYIIEEKDGKFFVKNKNVTKLEMAAILNTGIPSKFSWWDKLSGIVEKRKYIDIVLKGDFTDERNYTSKNRNWVCVQYATQMIINSVGFNRKKFSDRESFRKYGLGYIIPPISYGVPVYYAEASINKTNGHAFNAVYIGSAKNPFNDSNFVNWLFFDTETDEFIHADIISKMMLSPIIRIHSNIQCFYPDGQVGEGEYRDKDMTVVSFIEEW